MSHGYTTTIRMGAAHFDISFGGQRVDLAALLYGQPHVEQYRILREASAAVCKLHGIEPAKRVETKKRVSTRTPQQQPRATPSRTPRDYARRRPTMVNRDTIIEVTL